MEFAKYELVASTTSKHIPANPLTEDLMGRLRLASPTLLSAILGFEHHIHIYQYNQQPLIPKKAKIRLRTK